MSKWAVSYINWFDNNLQTKIVEAETWDAALNASGFYGPEEMEMFTSASTFEEAKQHAFDMDSTFEVVEIV